MYCVVHAKMYLSGVKYSGREACKPGPIYLSTNKYTPGQLDSWCRRRPSIAQV